MTDGAFYRHRLAQARPQGLAVELFFGRKSQFLGGGPHLPPVLDLGTKLVTFVRDNRLRGGFPWLVHRFGFVVVRLRWR
jgi:hypothetical protein